MENAIKDYLSGLAAGVATVLIGHPFDTVKVKLQAQHTDSHSLKYRNALDCTVQILRSEGARGFYRGATSSFVGVAVESSLLFGFYSQARRVLRGGDNDSPTLLTVVPAAAVAGAAVSTILCPTELVKCRLQVQTRTSESALLLYSGPWDCVKKTVRRDGITGMFRGGITTLLRESLGNSVFFCTYEFSKSYLQAATHGQLFKSNFLLGESEYSRSQLSDVLLEAAIATTSGGLAGIAFWATVLPLDVAKTRIQTSLDPKTSRNPFHHLSQVRRTLGIRGLYAGLGPTLVRAFPANAAAVVTWELTARLLNAR